MTHTPNGPDAADAAVLSDEELRSIEQSINLALSGWPNEVNLSKASRLIDHIAALTAERDRLQDVLAGLLDVAERCRAGDDQLRSEEWYLWRDEARAVLQGGSDE